MMSSWVSRWVKWVYILHPGLVFYSIHNDRYTSHQRYFKFLAPTISYPPISGQITAWKYKAIQTTYFISTVPAAYMNQHRGQVDMGHGRKPDYYNACSRRIYQQWHPLELGEPWQRVLGERKGLDGGQSDIPCEPSPPADGLLPSLAG